MKGQYPMYGVCAMGCEVEVEDGKLVNCEFYGGCDGNHKGIVSLAKGCDIVELADKLEGITCGRRPTSCPDQLAKILRKIASEQAEA